MAAITGKLRAQKIRIKAVKHNSVEGYWITLKEREPQQDDIILMYFHGNLSILTQRRWICYWNTADACNRLPKDPHCAEETP